MEISKQQKGSKLVIALEGRLDTMSSPQLEEELKRGVLDDITELTFDLSKLDYISSSGLRVLLAAHKTMMNKGVMYVTGSNATILEVFEVTGFSDLLNLK